MKNYVNFFPILHMNIWLLVIDLVKAVPGRLPSRGPDISAALPGWKKGKAGVVGDLSLEDLTEKRWKVENEEVLGSDAAGAEYPAKRAKENPGREFEAKWLFQPVWLCASDPG